MKIKIVIAVFLIQNLYFITVTAQRYPFPQNVTYKHGYMSEYITDKDAQRLYEKWKNNFVLYCGDHEARIVKAPDQPNTTISEGIGYALAIVAYAGDRELFDKFLNYYVARRNMHGMMNWIYEGCESGDNMKNGATDAEMDAALALIVASKQWPEDKRYKEEADMITDSMQVHYFTMCDDVIVQKPGDFFGGCNCTNPSYYSPAYYRVFAKFKEEEGNTAARDFWNQAADDVYVTLLKNANPYTGLVYAWTNSGGGDPSDCYYEVTGGGVYNSVQYDACRIPWRITNDYLWWGDPQAEALIKKLSHFVNTPVYTQFEENGDTWYGAGGIENIVDNYWTNGLRRIQTDRAGYGHYHTVPFVGAFALTSMSTSQEDTDTAMKEFQSMEPENYFNTCLSVLYTFLATGNFWNPYNMDEQ